MQVDITNVLNKINEATTLANGMDAQDVTTADMKSMNHAKKYTDGILDHIEANPNLDPKLLEEIKQCLLEYRNAINNKHGEAQGKSDFIAAKSDDINQKFDDLINIEKAIKKAKEIGDELASKGKELDGKNALVNPQGQPNNNVLPPPDGWQEAELTLISAALKLTGFCLKVGVALPCHLTAAVIGGGAGIVTNASNTIGMAYNNRIEQNKQRLVDISTEDFVTRSNEANNIEAGSKLMTSLSNISAFGLALSSKGADVLKEKSSGVIQSSLDVGSKLSGMASKGSDKLLENLSNELDKAKKLYEDSCIALSVKSREKLRAVNDDIKKITEGLVGSIKSNFSSLSENIKGWGSKISDTLSKISSNIKMLFKPAIAQDVAKGEIVVSM
jgi:hypothetical protein